MGIQMFRVSLILLLLECNCLMPAKPGDLQFLSQKAPRTAEESAPVIEAPATQGSAQTNEKSASPWFEPTHVMVHLPGRDGGTCDVNYDVSPTQGLRITANFATGEGDRRQTGEMMVVNGRSQWLLVKNIPMKKGYEIDGLDVFMLSFEMVVRLLYEAAPAGPSQITKRTAFNIHEKARDLRVNTTSADEEIKAPWTLEGTIEPVAAGLWSFDLTATHDEPVHVSGTWQKGSVAPVFADDMPLDGWQILTFGIAVNGQSKGFTFDSGGQSAKEPPKTLGELLKLTAK